MRLSSHFSHAPQKTISRKAVIEYRRQECGVGLADSLKHGGNTHDGVDEDIPQTHDAQIGGTVGDHLLAEIPPRILDQSWHGIQLMYLDKNKEY